MLKIVPKIGIALFFLAAIMKGQDVYKRLMDNTMNSPGMTIFTTIQMQYQYFFRIFLQLIILFAAISIILMFFYIILYSLMKKEDKEFDAKKVLKFTMNLFLSYYKRKSVFLMLLVILPIIISVFIITFVLLYYRKPENITGEEEITTFKKYIFLITIIAFWFTALYLIIS